MNVIVFGKDQKVMTYSDTVNADKIISLAIIVYDKFTTILWQYIIFLFWMIYLSSKQKIKRIDYSKCNGEQINKIP